MEQHGLQVRDGPLLGVRRLRAEKKELTLWLSTSWLILTVLPDEIPQRFRRDSLLQRRWTNGILVVVTYLAGFYTTSLRCAVPTKQEKKRIQVCTLAAVW